MNDYKDSQESRVERLNSMIREGRIIRKNWVSTDEQGREVACLLAALSPEAGNAENPAACPASVMPEWFAHLTPWLDDACSDAEWPRVVRRYAACAARWSALDEAAWRRVEIAARRAAVVEAMSHTSDEQVLAASREVLTWLDADMPESSYAAVKATEAAMEAAEAAAIEARAAATGAATEAAMEAAEAWGAWAESTESAAKAAAWRAWSASTESAAHWALAAARAEAAESSAEAAMAAMRAAPWAAADAADAADAAARAPWAPALAAATAEGAATAAAAAARAAWAKAARAGMAASAEASDRIIDAVLSYLEKECGL